RAPATGSDASETGVTPGSIVSSFPAEPEGREVEAGSAFVGQVRQRLADRGGELEAMARAGARHNDPRLRREAVDQKISVGCVGVEAHRRLPRRARDPGHPMAEHLLQPSRFLRGNVAPYLV